MQTLGITIQRKTLDHWPVVAESSTGSEGLPVHHEGMLGLDLEEVNQSPPENLGRVLGQALFRGEIRHVLDQSMAQAQDLLHVQLSVEDPDLRSLPWERLCAPIEDGWNPLALDQRTPFSLYVPSRSNRRFPPLGRKDLRALILVANPDGLEDYRLAPFDALAAVQGVREALGPIPADVLAYAEGSVGPPTLDALAERISVERYTLLHLVCHGAMRRDDGELVLYLGGADRRVTPVIGARFLDRLARLPGLPHLVFLETSESAAPAAAGAMSGLAQRLVRELGIPAVVAMTDRVTIATAQELARAFYRRLRDHGEVDRALTEARAGLIERLDSLIPALYSRLGGRPLFSDIRDTPLTAAEIAGALDRCEAWLGERAPVLLATFAEQAGVLREGLDSYPWTVSAPPRLRREQALTRLDSLCMEALEISFEALARGQEPPPYDGRCPFRGLEPFRPEDREFFFGRDAVVAQLRERVDRADFLAVVGASGNGKTSIVLAGLISALQADQAALSFVCMKPGAEPIASLETALGSLPVEHPSLLVVDQFEELFTLSDEEVTRQEFLDRLLEQTSRMRVVLILRADFWGECARYPRLRELMLANQGLIGAMSSEDLRRAAEMQANAVGLRFEPGLIGTILDDVAEAPGAMPLMQYALLELWYRRHGRRIKTEEYRALGGTRGAIQRTAEQFYAQLSADEQEAVRDLFLRLIRVDEGGQAVSGRRVRMDQLIPAGADPGRIERIVARLADRRLVVSDRDSMTGGREVELAHEALIRSWPRVRAWLDEDRSLLQLREAISRAARDWERFGKNPDRLIHRGSLLEEAEVLVRNPRFPLTALERDYVEACEEFWMRNAPKPGEETPEQVFANGIDAASGDYVMPTLFVQDIVVMARQESHDPKELAELRARWQRESQATF